MYLRNSAFRGFDRAICLFALLLGACLAAPLPAQASARADLVAALRHGGQVILMRHASSPRATPDSTTADPENTLMERQLDGTGRAAAIAMGKAFRELGIPIGAVLCSPTYRARQTVGLAQLPPAKTYVELGDGGQSMAGVSAAQGQWLREQTSALPKGSNTLIVTHFPNINAAFPQYARDLEDGEALVFGTDGNGGIMLLARVKIEEWPTLGQLADDAAAH